MLKSRTMSVYHNTEDTKGKRVNLGYVVERVMYGAGSHPAVTFSGIFPPGERSAACLESHSGLIALHLKVLAEQRIPDLLESLRRLQGVALVFRQPRKVDMLTCVIHVDPVPENADEHTKAFEAAKAHVNSLKYQHRFRVDNYGADCSDLSYITRDFDRIVTYYTTPLTWQREEPQEIQDPASISNSDESENLRPADLTAAHSIQDFHRVLGGSYERARQCWHKAGGKEYLNAKEAELTDQIQELNDGGLSQRDIADILGIKRYEVRKVLEKKSGRNCNISKN